MATSLCTLIFHTQIVETNLSSKIFNLQECGSHRHFFESDSSPSSFQFFKTYYHLKTCLLQLLSIVEGPTSLMREILTFFQIKIIPCWTVRKHSIPESFMITQFLTLLKARSFFLSNISVRKKVIVKSNHTRPSND